MTLACIPMTLPGLDPTEERAWRCFRALFTLLEARLSRELAEQTSVSMADYSVLSTLVEMPGRRARPSQLAGHLEWSQSRLSHQLSRMERRGLLARERVPHDARGIQIVATRAGLRAIAEATPVHLAGVREHMLDLLTPQQVEALAELSETVVAHLTEDPESHSAAS